MAASWIFAGLLLLAPLRTFADDTGRLAVLAGGAGEESDDNFLIQDLRDFAKRLKARGWQVTAAAGARDGLITANSRKGDDADIRSAVQSATLRAQAGDELLVVLHSHGRAREKEWGQRSHSIVSEDKDASGAEPGLDLDSLEATLAQAANRGVKVALVDLSCYSGATQELLKSSASCTATLAAPDYISLCSGRPEERHFSARFLDLPAAGIPVTLEQKFLAARRGDLDSINLPAISSRSTPAFAEWNDLLVNTDPLDIYEDLKNYRAGPKPFRIDRLLSALPKSPATETQRTELRKKLTQLLGARARLEKQVRRMAQAFDETSLELKLPGRASFKISPGNLADLLDHAADQANLDGYSDAQKNLIATLRTVRDAPGLASLTPALTSFRERKARFDADTDALADAAGQAMDVERSLYDILSRPVLDPARAAACRDFAL